MKRILIVTCCLALSISTAFSQQFYEYFDYPVNEELIGKTSPAGTGWIESVSFPSTEANRIKITDKALLFPGYKEDGNSVALYFAEKAGSAASIKFPDNSPLILPSSGSGVVYLSFLVNVSRSMSNSSHFLSLATNKGTLRARVYVKRNTLSGLSFGVGNSNKHAENAYTDPTIKFAINSPLLLVVKYEKSEKAGVNDAMSLFVFEPSKKGKIPAKEPKSPDAFYNAATEAKPAINGITLVQPPRNVNEKTDVQVHVSGIRAGSTWAEVMTAGEAK